MRRITAIKAPDTNFSILDGSVSVRVSSLEHVDNLFTVYILSHATVSSTQATNVTRLSSYQDPSVSVITDRDSQAEFLEINLADIFEGRDDQYFSIVVSSGTDRFLREGRPALPRANITAEDLEREGLKNDLGTLFLLDEREFFVQLTTDQQSAFSEFIKLDIDLTAQPLGDEAAWVQRSGEFVYDQTISMLPKTSLGSAAMKKTGQVWSQNHFGGLSIHPQGGELQSGAVPPAYEFHLQKRARYYDENDNVVFEQTIAVAEFDIDRNRIYDYMLENLNLIYEVEEDSTFSAVEIDLLISVRSTSLTPLTEPPTTVNSHWTGYGQILYFQYSNDLPFFYDRRVLTGVDNTPPLIARSLTASDFPLNPKSGQLVSLNRTIIEDPVRKTRAEAESEGLVPSTNPAPATATTFGATYPMSLATASFIFHLHTFYSSLGDSAPIIYGSPNGYLTQINNRNSYITPYDVFAAELLARHFFPSRLSSLNFEGFTEEDIDVNAGTYFTDSGGGTAATIFVTPLWIKTEVIPNAAPADLQTNINPIHSGSVARINNIYDQLRKLTTVDYELNHGLSPEGHLSSSTVSRVAWSSRYAGQFSQFFTQDYNLAFVRITELLVVDSDNRMRLLKYNADHDNGIDVFSGYSEVAGDFLTAGTIYTPGTYERADSQWRKVANLTNNNTLNVEFPNLESTAETPSRRATATALSEVPRNLGDLGDVQDTLGGEGEVLTSKNGEAIWQDPTTNVTVKALTTDSLPSSVPNGTLIALSVSATYTAGNGDSVTLDPGLYTWNESSDTWDAFTGGDSAQVETNKDNIADNAADITTLQGEVAGNTTSIGALTDRVDNLPSGGGGGDDAYPWATEGNTDPIPASKLANAPDTGDDAYAWATVGNTDLIPDAKLPAASGGGGAVHLRFAEDQRVTSPGTITDASLITFEMFDSDIAAGAQRQNDHDFVSTIANFGTNASLCWITLSDGLFIARGSGNSIRFYDPETLLEDSSKAVTLPAGWELAPREGGSLYNQDGKIVAIQVGDYNFRSYVLNNDLSVDVSHAWHQPTRAIDDSSDRLIAGFSDFNNTVFPFVYDGKRFFFHSHTEPYNMIAFDLNTAARLSASDFTIPHPPTGVNIIAAPGVLHQYLIFVSNSGSQVVQFYDLVNSRYDTSVVNIHTSEASNNILQFNTVNNLFYTWFDSGKDAKAYSAGSLSGFVSHTVTFRELKRLIAAIGPSNIHVVGGEIGSLATLSPELADRIIGTKAVNRSHQELTVPNPLPERESTGITMARGLTFDTTFRHLYIIDTSNDTARPFRVGQTLGEELQALPGGNIPLDGVADPLGATVDNGFLLVSDFTPTLPRINAFDISTRTPAPSHPLHHEASIARTVAMTTYNGYLYMVGAYNKIWRRPLNGSGSLEIAMDNLPASNYTGITILSGGFAYLSTESVTLTVVDLENKSLLPNVVSSQPVNFMTKIDDKVWGWKATSQASNRLLEFDVVDKDGSSVFYEDFAMTIGSIIDRANKQRSIAIGNVDQHYDSTDARWEVTEADKDSTFFVRKSSQFDPRQHNYILHIEETTNTEMRFAVVNDSDEPLVIESDVWFADTVPNPTTRKVTLEKRGDRIDFYKGGVLSAGNIRLTYNYRTAARPTTLADEQSLISGINIEEQNNLTTLTFTNVAGETQSVTVSSAEIVRTFEGGNVIAEEPAEGDIQIYQKAGGDGFLLDGELDASKNITLDTALAVADSAAYVYNDAESAWYWYIRQNSTIGTLICYDATGARQTTLDIIVPTIGQYDSIYSYGGNKLYLYDYSARTSSFIELPGETAPATLPTIPTLPVTCWRIYGDGTRAYFRQETTTGTIYRLDEEVNLEAKWQTRNLSSRSYFVVIQDQIVAAVPSSGLYREIRGSHELLDFNDSTIYSALSLNAPRAIFSNNDDTVYGLVGNNTLTAIFYESAAGYSEASYNILERERSLINQAFEAAQSQSLVNTLNTLPAVTPNQDTDNLLLEQFTEHARDMVTRSTANDITLSRSITDPESNCIGTRNGQKRIIIKEHANENLKFFDFSGMEHTDENFDISFHDGAIYHTVWADSRSVVVVSSSPTSTSVSAFDIVSKRRDDTHPSNGRTRSNIVYQVGWQDGEYINLIRQSDSERKQVDRLHVITGQWENNWKPTTAGNNTHMITTDTTAYADVALQFRAVSLQQNILSFHNASLYDRIETDPIVSNSPMLFDRDTNRLYYKNADNGDKYHALTISAIADFVAAKTSVRDVATAARKDIVVNQVPPTDENGAFIILNENVVNTHVRADSTITFGDLGGGRFGVATGTTRANTPAQGQTAGSFGRPQAIFEWWSIRAITGGYEIEFMWDISKTENSSFYQLFIAGANHDQFVYAGAASQTFSDGIRREILTVESSVVLNLAADQEYAFNSRFAGVFWVFAGITLTEGAYKVNSRNDVEIVKDIVSQGTALPPGLPDGYSYFLVQSWTDDSGTVNSPGLYRRLQGVWVRVI